MRSHSTRILSKNNELVHLTPTAPTLFYTFASFSVTRRVKGYTRKYVTGKFVTGRRKRFRLANGK